MLSVQISLIDLIGGVQPIIDDFCTERISRLGSFCNLKSHIMLCETLPTNLFRINLVRPISQCLTFSVDKPLNG